MPSPINCSGIANVVLPFHKVKRPRLLLKLRIGFGLSWGLAEEAGWAFANWVNMAMTRFHGLNVHLMGLKTAPSRLGQP